MDETPSQMVQRIEGAEIDIETERKEEKQRHENKMKQIDDREKQKRDFVENVLGE